MNVAVGVSCIIEIIVGILYDKNYRLSAMTNPQPNFIFGHKHVMADLVIFIMSL